MNDVIEKVKEFAAAAHDGQRRKYTPEPYIAHPVRVMELCMGENAALPVLCAALLHDVLEDTEVEEDVLELFLLSVMDEEEARRTLQLVLELTDVFTKSSYPKLNRHKRKMKEADRIGRTSAEAQTIRYADIIDNCTDIIKYDEEFGPKFLRECRMLLARIPRGNQALYRRARKVVEEGLAQDL